MAKMEASVLINRPVEEVFEFLSDVGNWPQWNSTMSEAEQTSEDPVAVGATARGVSEFLGQRIEWTSEVTEYEPNRKVKLRIISGPMLMEQSLTFEPVEGATRLTMAGEGEFGGLFKLAQPVVNRSMKKQSEANLANLKDILEAEA